MRNSVKIVIAVLAVVVVSAALFLCLGNKGSAEETKREPLPLFAALDSADMMIAYAEGLGDARQERTVDGRLYRNFVQLLRTNRMQESLQDTFTTNCKTGARLALFKDTTLVEEFLFADRIGRVGVPGTWTPGRFGKINKFLKDVGVHFKPCVDSEGVDNANDVLSQAIAESQRPVLTMPKFGANRKARKNMERESARDSIASLAAEISKPDPSLFDESMNAVKILDELILPADTAVGVPIAVQFEQMNEGSVSFFNEDGTERKDDYIVLTKGQMKELGELLKHSRLETFATSQQDGSKKYSQITLFGDDGKVMRLWRISEKSSYLVKFHQGDRFSNFEGFWVPEDATALKTFFDNLKATRPE